MQYFHLRTFPSLRYTPVITRCEDAAAGPEEDDEDPGYEVRSMLWGFVPPWHRGDDPTKHGLTTNNARLEGIAQSKLYKSALAREGQVSSWQNMARPDFAAFSQSLRLKPRYEAYFRRFYLARVVHSYSIRRNIRNEEKKLLQVLRERKNKMNGILVKLLRHWKTWQNCTQA